MPAQLSPVGGLQQPAPHVAIPMPAFAPEEEDQHDRIKAVAYQALKYTALAAMTVSTTALLAGGTISTLGGLCIIGIVAPLTISCGVYSAVNQVRAIPQIPVNDQTINQTAQKVEKAARSLLWASLVVGAIVLGFGGAGLIAGAMKIAAFSPFSVLIGFRDIAFALGFLIPFGKALLVNANTIDNRLHSFITRIQAAIQQVVSTAVAAQGAGAPPLFQALLALIIGQDQLLWEGMLPILEMLPSDMDDKVKTEFMKIATTLSVEQIKDVQRRCPRIFTYEFLLSTLSKDQIDQVILPQLETPLTEKQLDHMHKDLQTWSNKLIQFQQRYAQINPDDKDAMAEFHEEVTPILVKLSQYTNAVASFKSLLKRLPPPSMEIAHKEARDTIEDLRKLEIYYPEENGNATPIFEQVYATLMQTDNKALKTSLIDISNKLTAKLAKNAPEEEDLSEEAYMTLSAVCGFRLHEFKKLAPYYDCTPDIGAVSEALAALGISTREDLFKYKILIKGEKTETQVVMERLIDFSKSSHATLPAATAIPLPAPAPLSSPPPVDSPRVPHRHPQPVDSDVPRGAPAQPSMPVRPSEYQRTMHRVALVTNHVYHYTTSAALIGIQVFNQPLSTAAGFAYGILGASERHIDQLRLTREWQTSPNYTGQSIPQRARELWSRIFLTSATMWVGPIGGFVAGMNHADAVRYYAGPLINRIVQVN